MKTGFVPGSTQFRRLSSTWLRVHVKRVIDVYKFGLSLLPLNPTFVQELAKRLVKMEVLFRPGAKQ